MISGESRKLTEPSSRNPSLCHIRLRTGEICPQSCKGEWICHHQLPQTNTTRVVSNDSLDPSSKGIRESQCFKPDDLITEFVTLVICNTQMTSGSRIEQSMNTGSIRSGRPSSILCESSSWWQILYRQRMGAFGVGNTTTRRDGVSEDGCIFKPSNCHAIAERFPRTCHLDGA